jgi:hypothetical protein
MYDSVEVGEIPTDAVAVAGYVGGIYPTESLLVAKFPHARHKSIAVNAGEDADILDIENGDAVPSEAPAWFKRQKARGLEKPGVYSSASEIPSVFAAMNAAGINRSEYVVWLAHYTFVDPTPPFEQGADAVQWTDRSLDRNLDQSACELAFFTNTPPVPIRNPDHYDWFDSTKRKLFGWVGNEKATVEKYDKYRALQTKTKHPHRAQLALLRRHLKYLANRVAGVSKRELKNGKPSWGIDHRGWRYQQLVHRAQGQRFN